MQIGKSMMIMMTDADGDDNDDDDTPNFSTLPMCNSNAFPNCNQQLDIKIYHIGVSTTPITKDGCDKILTCYFTLNASSFNIVVREDSI